MSEKKETPGVPETPETPEIPETPEASEAPEGPETASEAPEMLEAPETPEQQEHHPVKQSSGSSGAFLAIIISIVAIGGFFYLWQQLRSAQIGSMALEQSFERLLNMVEEGHQAQLQHIETLSQHRHQGTEAQLAQVETTVQDMRRRLGQERSDWAIAEAEYLLRIAMHRLMLEHDRDTAIEILRQARNRLSIQDQRVFGRVIRRIDSDIDALTALSLPDIDRIATELTALTASVESWPLAARDRPPTEPRAETAPTETQAVSGDSQRILDRIWRDIKSLVTIRHTDEPPLPLLMPEQRFFLQQNLQLKLDAARLALLGGNYRAYHDGLTMAAGWLRHYFDTSATSVIQALSDIERLAAVDLEPELPELSNSIDLLQQASMQIRPNEGPQSESTIPAVPLEESATSTEPSTSDEPVTPSPAQSAEPPQETPTDVPASSEDSGQ